MTGSGVSDLENGSSRASPCGSDVLAALGDGDCRSILAAIEETPRSAAELATRCDLPLSTTYRKVNRLEAAGLLEEQTRLDPDRNHQSEYTASPADVCVSVDAEGGLRVTVSYDDDRDSRSFTVTD